MNADRQAVRGPMERQRQPRLARGIIRRRKGNDLKIALPLGKIVRAGPAHIAQARRRLTQGRGDQQIKAVDPPTGQTACPGVQPVH